MDEYSNKKPIDEKPVCFPFEFIDIYDVGSEGESFGFIFLGHDRLILFLIIKMFSDILLY